MKVYKSISEINGHVVGAIKRAIHQHVKRNSFLYCDYGNWYIGITNNIDRRRFEHEFHKNLRTIHFQFWDAKSKATAASIEKHFHNDGMKDKKGAGGARLDSTYVYIFKLHPHVLDQLQHMLEVLE